MPTTFYLRSSNIAINVYNDLAALERGPSTTTLSANTVSGGTWQSIAFWATKPLQAFTLSGTITMNFWGQESANQANCSLGLRVYRWIQSSQTLSASLGQATNTTELSAAQIQVRTATVTPTSTAFQDGDVLVLEAGLVNVGTMGAGQSGTLYFDGPTASASGDSFVTINENVLFHRRVVTTG